MDGKPINSDIARMKPICYNTTMPSTTENPIGKYIRLLADILGDVIRQQAGDELFYKEETIRGLAKERRAAYNGPDIEAKLAGKVEALSLAEKELIARAFTVYFELINLVEEHHRIRVLQERERQAQAQPTRDSIAEAIAHLQQQGLDQAGLQQLLDSLHIELVFTAHPTEARRRTILSKLRRIAQHLSEFDFSNLASAEQEALLVKIKAEITSLWVTERSLTLKPEVVDEVRTGLYYLQTTLWDTIPQVYRALEIALNRYYPGLRLPDRFLTFGSWMGGDRDGNPYVTADVTAQTLYFHRRLAAERHHLVAQPLGRSLSISTRLAKVSPALLEMLQAGQNHISEHLRRLQERYPQEPYRLLAARIADDLTLAAADEAMKERLLGTIDSPPPLCKQDELLQPLKLMDDSLREAGLPGIADAHLKQFYQQVQTFGLHTARLDIRQISTYNRQVLDEILRQIGYAAHYAQLSPTERTALLTKLLQQWPPSLDQLTSLSDQAEETLRLFQMLQRVVKSYGPEFLGPYVVSMTHGSDDILAVLLLARWVGLCLSPDNSSPEGLAIVPLFETREDLETAPAIMTALFTHPVYTNHLQRLDNHQMIMIGHSDSNKDAGYITAKWDLFRAQEALAACCRQHGVDLTFFHGRGGTAARGGGPTNRAILAQPRGSVAGKIRVTEQGEVIYERFGHPLIARRYLEQVVNAVLLASTPDDFTHQTLPLESWRTTMDELADSGLKAYRRLIYETPELLVYWQQATPIDEISQLQIGSRPARRTSSHEIADLRAIPWNFSWMQSRHVLPGWYGLGTALESYLAHQDRLPQLQTMYQEWPFFRDTINNAQVSLGKADMGIARLYASLVGDQRVRELVFGDIQAEYQRTRQTILKVTKQADILDNNKVLQASIPLRNPYVDPLNFIQVSLLRQLRALPDPKAPEAEAILAAILLTINGISSGLKNTG
jgi:phosphoenolpyruvate carboxylase